ncbi:hypothetical protein GCM10027174_31750 [Salinifilum aidingensis]
MPQRDDTRRGARGSGAARSGAGSCHRSRRRAAPTHAWWGGAATAPPQRRVGYRYWPVFVAVSIARPDSWFFPLTSVRM